MNTTFKKTLVAAAVLAFAGAAQAATISAGTEHELTSQYLTSTGANHTLANDFAVTLGAEYVVNDTITITLTQPLATAVTADITVAAVEGVGTAAKKGVTFAVISGGAVGDKTITYRLTTVTNTVGGGGNATPGVTSGVVLPLPAFAIKKTDLTSGATVSFSAKTNTGLDLDTSGGTARTRSLAKSLTQFTVTKPSMTKVIDVEADRKSFVGADTNAKKVTATFNIASEVTGGAKFARAINAAAGVKHTITGNFSWVVDDNTTTTGLQPKTGVFATTGTCTNPVWEYSTTAVSLTCDEIAANTAIVIDAEANKTGVAAASIPLLVAQSFTGTSRVKFTTPEAFENVIDNSDIGSWTLNGSTVVVPYMVAQYGKFSNIINVHNSGSKEGAITVDIWDEAGTVVKSGLAAGTSKPGSIVSVVSPVLTELAKTKDLNTQTKYSVRIITNVPAKDITVNSAYADTSGATVTRTPVANDSGVQNKGNL